MVSFDEWRKAKSEGKQAKEVPDFASWRKAKQTARIAEGTRGAVSARETAEESFARREKERQDAEFKQAQIALSEQGEQGVWGTDGRFRRSKAASSFARDRNIEATAGPAVNIAPQVAGAVIGGVATLGGVAADVLNQPIDPVLARLMEGAGVRRDPTQFSRAGADYAQSVQELVDERYPLPAAQQRFRAKTGEAEGFFDTLAAGASEPLGVAQEGLYQLGMFAPAAKAFGVIGGAAAVSGGMGGTSAASEFDAEWDKGIIQSSQRYQALAKEIGQDAAYAQLKGERIQRAALAQGAVGAATAGLASRFGGNFVDEALAGKMATGGFGKKIAGEIGSETLVEEPLDVITGNVVAQGTGSNRDTLEGVPQAAATAMLTSAPTAVGFAAPGIASDLAEAVRYGNSAAGLGASAAREALTRTGGLSDGKPERTPTILSGDSIVPTVQDKGIKEPTVQTVNTEEQNVGVISAAPDVKERTSEQKGVTPISAPLSPVQLSLSDAGAVIDRRLASLREASQANRLDDGTVRALQREDEELRLTLQEDEQRKQQGILQTPERPYLSDNARTLISNKRAEVRERLEQHRASVGYGNELRDLETRLAKLGDNDADVVALADTLLRGQSAWLAKASGQVRAVTPQNQSAALPATTPQATTPEAPTEPASSVPATSVTQPVGTPVPVVQSDVTSQQVPTISTKPAKTPKAPKAPATNKPISDKDAMVQALSELQDRAAQDPEFQKQVVAKPAEFRRMATERAAEIVAASKAQVAQAPTPAAPAVATTPATTTEAPAPALDVATPAPNKPKFESKQALLDELFSGGMFDKEASEAKKEAANIVVYDGDADLAAIDPVTAAKVEAAVKEQGDTGARPRAFQYNGKVYFNMEGVKPGEAKSAFLHEARVHLAGERDPARVSSLASRVVALAKAGDSTAREAAATVSKEYPKLVERAMAGNASAKDKQREELLADFAQRVYERVKSGQGVSGTIKRLYSDVVSYLRDVYTTVAKKVLGERFALSITDVDILDAVRYGRTAAGFKGTAPSSALSRSRTKAPAQVSNMIRGADSTITPDTVTEMPEGDATTRVGNRFLGAVATAFTPRGTASKEAQLMGERAVGVSNQLRLEGDVLTQAMNAQIAEAIAGMPEHKQVRYRYNIGQYLAGKKDLADSIPADLRATVDAMRELLDDGSMRLIALGAVKKEEIPKVINNLGRWIHRDYEMFHHTPGTLLDPGSFKKQAQALARAGKDPIANVLPAAIKDLELPSPDVINKLGEFTQKKRAKASEKQDVAAMVRQLKGKPHTKNPTKKSAAVVRKRAEAYLRDMAGKWGIGRNTPLEGPDGIIARLAALAKNDPQELREAAVRYANSMLEVQAPHTPNRPYTGKATLGVDDSALDKSREKLPDWLRELWGEFKDPASMFLVSIDNQATILSKFTALAEYKERGLKGGRVLPNTEGTNDAAMRKRGYTLLQNSDPLYYGPLQNHWVKIQDSDILAVAALGDLVGRQIRMSLGEGGWRLLSAPGQVAKMALIALDHTAQAVQHVSNFAMYAGTYKNFFDAVKGARYTAFGGTILGKAIENEQLDADVKTMVSSGLLVNNALAGDARRTLRDFVLQPGEALLPVGYRLGRKLGRAKDKVLDPASRLMSFSDEAAKIMMVYNRMEYLGKVYPDKSREELMELAIEHTKMTTPNLTREAPLARYLSNSGWVAPFATFFASVIRNFSNHAMLAAEYGRMPGAAAKKYAAKELLVLSVKAGAVHALTSALIASGASVGYLAAVAAQASGDDEEDVEKASKEAEAGAAAQKAHGPALRELVPDYQTGEVVILRQASDDEYVYASAQRFDPSPVGAVVSAYQREDWDEMGQILGGTLFGDAPLLRALTTSLATAPAAARDALGASALGEGYSANARDAKDVRKFWEEGVKEMLLGFTPGAAKRVYKQATGDFEHTGLERVIMNTGGTVGVVDVRKRAGEIAGDYKAVIDELTRTASASVSKKDGVVTETSAEFKDNLIERANAWRKARAKIAAVQSLGKSDAWIREAIKANPYASSLSKDEVNSLLSGRFRVPDYNKWLKGQRDRDLKDPKNVRRRDQIEQQYARYEQELDALYKGLEETLKEAGVSTDD